MKCQRCGRGEATVHVTDIIEKVRRERHLCDGCAAEAHLFGPLPPGDAGEPGDPLDPPATDAQGLPAVPELNLQALVQLIFGATSAPGAEGAGAARPADPSHLACARCGLGYAEFRKTGRLGCPADYDAFADALLSLLERVHRVAPGVGHAGKTPKRGGHLAELTRLRSELTAAIDSEDYETAARLRDAIRRKESDR